jgi:5-methylcytosine-specific restriction protein A
MIKEILTEISLNFLEEKKTSMANNSFADLIRKASEQHIKPKVLKNKDHFIYKSSPGRPPNWAAVPWIAIFDPNVTTSPQRGYYITYLFSVDMKRVYLNLNQGMTDLGDELGTKAAAQELHRRAEFIRDRVKEYKKFFSAKPINLSIDLAGSTNRPMLYEKGFAFGKEYDLSKKLNEDELINDLNNMINLYTTLIFRGGVDSEILDDYTSDESDEAEPKKELVLLESRRKTLHRITERSSRNARIVKQQLGYTCEVCGFNFKEKYGNISLNKKKEEFIEAHHKVPIYTLPENETIEFKIEDFAVLCSNCHRMAHKRKEPYTVEELKEFINTKVSKI